MTLQRIINYVMGVRYDTEEKDKIELNDIQEIHNPTVCERLDCLNYGTIRDCYFNLEGCRDYVKCKVKEK